MVSVGPSGTNATLKITTDLENSTKVVSEGERITYLFDVRGGSERYRSVLVEDVSRLPPRVVLWLPGDASVRSVPLIEKLSMTVRSALFGGW